MRCVDVRGAFSAFGSSDPALHLLQLCRDDAANESLCFGAPRVALTRPIDQKQKQSAENTSTDMHVGFSRCEQVMLPTQNPTGALLYHRCKYLPRPFMTILWANPEDPDESSSAWAVCLQEMATLKGRSWRISSGSWRLRGEEPQQAWWAQPCSLLLFILEPYVIFKIRNNPLHCTNACFQQRMNNPVKVARAPF